MKKLTALMICTLLAAAAIVPVSYAAEAPAMVVVGRIFHSEGDLLRNNPDEKDWTALVSDTPFGTEDTLFSGIQGKAELIIPNGSWIRIGNNTQIRIIALEADRTTVEVASGVARFYNKDSRTVIKVTSPYGYVLADPGTVFDFHVGGYSVEVIGIKGKVGFVHSSTGTRYDVTAGSPSLLAYDKQVSAGNGIVDSDWNRWNALRDDSWAAKTAVRGRSVEYLPPALHDEAYDLDENGSWERVYYEGSDRWFWRPTTVAIGWSPFTVGRWTNWYGDQTWIPAEPFGYVTHHYGNWVYAGNYWYWAPPVVSIGVGIPLLDVGFFWYPGRVSWVHSGSYIGWVPLAPRETYYCHRRWGGPHAVVVNSVDTARINLSVRNHAYVKHAVVVTQDDFYRVNSYRNVRVPGINRTILVNNYRAAPVVNNTMINNYKTNKPRNSYTNVKASEKPRNIVLDGIRPNETAISRDREGKTAVPQQQTKGAPEGRTKREAPPATLKVANPIAPAGMINLPKPAKYQQQNEVSNRTGATVRTGLGVAGKTDTKPGQPEVKGEGRQYPAKPAPQAPSGRQGQSVERSAPVPPAGMNRQVNSIQPRTLTAVPERMRTEKPAQQAQPGPLTPPAQQRERVKPSKQDHPEEILQPGQRTVRSARTLSTRPAQQEQRQ